MATSTETQNPVQEIKLYDTLQRKRVVFESINPGFVGLYVCGPTVYGHSHLGHARPYVTFDVVVRFLKHLGYRVRYVRNITDVGHLLGDADHGEDKIGQKAKLEQLEPMEVVQQYSLSFQEDMHKLNILDPSIEPRASGHIPEQIELTQRILDAGYAYVADGSVYFDVDTYHKDHHYGKLSGRIIEDLLAASRDNLDGQEEKRNPQDFALWKKAAPEHIMRWNSPWSVGFPGWHIECSAMSTKYLGDTFDIHGGGMDLMFPHHECEIAQSQAGNGCEPAKYWMHCNMITINGQKMGKSLGNFINLKELFAGSHPLLEQAYSPMTVRFFILQSQYRSTLDFSNAGLQGAAKGLIKILNGVKTSKDLNTVTEGITPDQKLEAELQQLMQNNYDALADDFNTAMVVANLFDMLKKINSFSAKPAELLNISGAVLEAFLDNFRLFVVDILGILPELDLPGHLLLDSLIRIYTQAKAAKDYAQIDALRADLKVAGIAIKDTKFGISWAYIE